MAVLEGEMARKKAHEGDIPSGDVIAENLARLGYADQVIRLTEIVGLIKERTGKQVSRQRIANILGSLRVYPDTVEMLAKGLGVKPEELTRAAKKGGK
jgi:isopentenyl phosphate kinase